jgi:hypothetical protein
LYGSEVWGVGKNDNIEKIHLQFLKRNLGVKYSSKRLSIVCKDGAS